MLSVCREALVEFDNVETHLMTGPIFADKFNSCFDFVLAFDVFVHMDLHTMFKYFKQIRGLLKLNGRAFFSTADVTSELGWERFSKQRKFSVGGFYFVCREMVSKLVQEAGLTVVLSLDKGGESNNTYYRRDFLLVVERDDGPSSSR